MRKVGHGWFAIIGFYDLCFWFLVSGKYGALLGDGGVMDEDEDIELECKWRYFDNETTITFVYFKSV